MARPPTTAPVDGYDVQYRVKDAEPEFLGPPMSPKYPVTTNSATITGLEYSTTYEVQVRSRNSEGKSGWSPSGEAASQPAIERVLRQFGTYTVTEGSSTTITVNVSPTADRSLSIPVSTSSSNAESGDYSPTGTTTLSFAPETVPSRSPSPPPTTQTGTTRRSACPSAP